MAGKNGSKNHKNGETVLRSTILDITSHVIISMAAAIVFYKVAGGWSWPVLVIMGGVLIDVDHFFDYFLYYGPRFDLMDFFTHGYQASGKCYVLFHSWELIVLLWGVAFFVDWMIPVATGMTLHIMTDFLFSHRLDPKCMSLLYRYHLKFERDKMEEVNGRKKHVSRGGGHEVG